jgi:hypothetical protein
MMSSNITPIRATISKRYPSTAVCGTTLEDNPGANEPNIDGPRRTPANISPITVGWPTRWEISPSSRAVARRIARATRRWRMSECEAATKGESI